MKKANLNKTFYHLHIQNGEQWGNLWDLLINDIITNKLNTKMNEKYCNV
jgi:hypothetical protein